MLSSCPHVIELEHEHLGLLVLLSGFLLIERCALSCLELTYREDWLLLDLVAHEYWRIEAVTLQQDCSWSISWRAGSNLIHKLAIASRAGLGS